MTKVEERDRQSTRGGKEETKPKGSKQLSPLHETIQIIYESKSFHVLYSLDNNEIIKFRLIILRFRDSIILPTSC